MRISVEREKCAGSGLCTVAAPDVFDQSEDDGQVTLLAEVPPAEALERVRAAAARCPAEAISISGDHDDDESPRHPGEGLSGL